MKADEEKSIRLPVILPLLYLILQAPAYLANLHAIALIRHYVDFERPSFFWISSIIILTAGTMFVMWLG
ncbi:MAG: hypothetical protein MZV63_39695 [Marinilabiliales bacterium]|nr:hypothetical protein [Marinilabiliales bacterium]